MRHLILFFSLIISNIMAEQYIVSVPLNQSQRTNFKESHKTYDFASPAVTNSAELIINDLQYQKLLNEGYEVNIKARSSEQRAPSDFSTIDETWNYIDSLSKAFPDLCYYDTIGYSQRYQKPIIYVKISDNVTVDEDEPGALFNGMVHAREPMGNQIILHTMGWLLKNYQTNSTAKRYIDEYELHFVPIVNPDGWWYIYEYYTSNPWWRKNMRDNVVDGSNFSRNQDGVDLNRNFNWHWGGAGDPDITSWKYYGTSGNSESELIALDSAAARSRALVGASYHSYGPYVMYPYSYNGKTTPDNKTIYEMAYELTDHLGSWYKSPQRLGGAGQGSDYLYGKYGILDFTIEVASNFIPSPTERDKEIQGNFNGICYLLDRMTYSGITGHVTDYITGEPIEAEVKVLNLSGDKVEPRMTDPVYGRFYRLLKNGTYDLAIYKDGFISDTTYNIKIVSDSLVYLPIKLMPLGVSIKNTDNKKLKNHIFISGDDIRLKLNRNISAVKIYNAKGKLIDQMKFSANNSVITILSKERNHSSGAYFIQTISGKIKNTEKVILQ